MKILTRYILSEFIKKQSELGRLIGNYDKARANLDEINSQLKSSSKVALVIAARCTKSLPIS